MTCCPYPEIGAGVTRQHLVPFGWVPLLPLVLGQVKRDWSGLETNEPPSPSSDTSLDEGNGGGVQILSFEVATQPGDFPELAS